jgi:hypothetical protein
VRQATAMRRQRGQITIFLMMVAIPIALGIAYLFNSADLFSRKIRVQDGADAAALAQASWMARSLNAMAHNNVALTQTEVVNSLSATIVLTVGELETELFEQGVKAASEVATCPEGLLVCARGIARAALIVDAQLKLFDLEALIKASVGEFRDHALDYGRANDRIFKRFPDFSARMQKSLATTNGLATVPRMQMIGWDKSPWVPGDKKYASTGLPASRVDAAGIVKGENASDLLTLIWIPLRSVNYTGWHGSRRLPFPMARNFVDHGYKRDDGPYDHPRNDVKGKLEDVIQLADAMEALDFNVGGWQPNVGERKPKYDDCWDAASSVAIVPVVCKKGAPIGLPDPGNGNIQAFPPVYAPAAAPQLDSDLQTWGITDILVLQSSAGSEHMVAANRFPSALPASYAFSKARLYNAMAPDLYSSDWRAALVPVQNWNRGDTTLPKQLRATMNNLSRADAKLAGTLNLLSNAELQRVLLH